MGKENKPQKYRHCIDENFREECFFEDVLINCYENNLIDNETLSRIYYERMEILKVKLKYYTKDESSSVMVEVAESLLQCIDYTIGIYLKTFDNIELVIEELKNKSLDYIVKMGHDLIKEKVLEGKKLLQEINKNKLKVDNYSYNDTIDYGIPLFFKEYEDFFAAHETPGSIDYQLCMDNMNYVGIEYIYNYLKILFLENEFCKNFDICEIINLLKGYDRKCELLLINIFELVLINSLGIIICDKSLINLDINSMDRVHIKTKLGKLSLEELQKELLKYAKICCEILDIKDIALIDYITKSTLKISLFINESIKIDKLETVFISFNKDCGNEFIKYIDGEKISNSVFKKLSEEIRECSSVQDKITLIKNNIKSLEDLVDMLSAECLFGDEYNMYFKSLSQTEIVLLSKYISDLSFEGEYEKEWYFQFNNYLASFSEKERLAIRKFKERIELI